MKDITRIHIAKIPYSIELPAKKEFETYLNSLEAYTHDAELFQDIEIRITELLLERGIKPEDVVSIADTQAVRKQLGEPEDFMSDDTPSMPTENNNTQAPRTVYRNLETAIAGGVLGGIATYFRIDAVWLRLAFIILLPITAGLAALVYIVAWIIIPPARSATEILQMNNRSVTLASIREVNEAGTTAAISRRQARIKRIFTVLLGIGAVLTGLGAAALLLLVALQVFFNQDLIGNDYGFTFIAFFISGALLIALAVLVAFASFQQKFNTRIWVSGLIITMLGLATFGTGIIGGYTIERTVNENLQREMITTNKDLPETFKEVKNLTVDIPYGTTITYIATASNPTLKQRVHPNTPTAKVTVADTSATVSLPGRTPQSSELGVSYTIHGPALDSITIKNGNVLYEDSTQQKLLVTLNKSANLTLSDSRITALEVAMRKDSTLDAAGTSVTTANLTLENQATATLGNIKSLTVNAPESCGTDITTQLKVKTILDNTLTYNESAIPVKSIENPCFYLTVGDEDIDD